MECQFRSIELSTERKKRSIGELVSRSMMDRAVKNSPSSKIFLRVNGSFDFLSVAQLSALMHVPREHRGNRSKGSRKLDQNLSKTSRISLCFFPPFFFLFIRITSRSLPSSRGSRRCPTRRFPFRIVSCIWFVLSFLINSIIVHSFYHLTRSREKVHGATCFARWHLAFTPRNYILHAEFIDRLLGLFMG